MAAFRHFDLALLNPAFDSPLVDVLTELEHLRRLKLAGTTPAPVFFQLKRVFHMLESLGSARIEGNHTTLADYVESSLEGTATADDHLSEIANIEEAMTYIESAMQPLVPTGSGKCKLPNRSICRQTVCWWGTTCRSWCRLSIGRMRPSMT